MSLVLVVKMPEDPEVPGASGAPGAPAPVVVAAARALSCCSGSAQRRCFQVSTGKTSPSGLMVIMMPVRLQPQADSEGPGPGLRVSFGFVLLAVTVTASRPVSLRNMMPCRLGDMPLLPP